MARVGLRWETQHGIWVGTGGKVVRQEGRFLDICSGQCADICMRVWAWDRTRDVSYDEDVGFLEGGELGGGPGRP
jgi:hypothetical protein